jgi:hypothetical protein
MRSILRDREPHVETERGRAEWRRAPPPVAPRSPSSSAAPRGPSWSAPGTTRPSGRSCSSPPPRPAPAAARARRCPARRPWCAQGGRMEHSPVCSSGAVPRQTPDRAWRGRMAWAHLRGVGGAAAVAREDGGGAPAADDQVHRRGERRGGEQRQRGLEGRGREQGAAEEPAHGLVALRTCHAMRSGWHRRGAMIVAPLAWRPTGRPCPHDGAGYDLGEGLGGGDQRGVLVADHLPWARATIGRSRRSAMQICGRHGGTPTHRTPARARAPRARSPPRSSRPRARPCAPGRAGGGGRRTAFCSRALQRLTAPCSTCCKVLQGAHGARQRPRRGAWAPHPDVAEELRGLQQLLAAPHPLHLRAPTAAPGHTGPHWATLVGAAQMIAVMIAIR